LSHGGISEKNREAIKAWRKNGNLFGIVTGRGAEFPHAILKENLELDFVSVFNGTDVYDMTQTPPKLISRLLGRTERLAEILPILLRQKGDWAEFVALDRKYYLTYGDEDSNRGDWVTCEAFVNAKVNAFLHIIALYDTDKAALEIARQLNENYSDAVSALVNGNWVNICPSGVTKASGVREYAKIMSVSAENVYTIGDSYNDLDMIKAFNGYTLENGAGEVKKAAKGIYKGVWELIETELANAGGAV
jgi:hypothetical protein